MIFVIFDAGFVEAVEKLYETLKLKHFTNATHNKES